MLAANINQKTNEEMIMHSSLSNSCIPAAQAMLHNLSHILTKGEEAATARKFDASILINARLAPDMFPLSRQVQISCDGVKNGLARIAGIEPPKFEDTETTFPSCKSASGRRWTSSKPSPPTRLTGMRIRTSLFQPEKIKRAH